MEDISELFLYIPGIVVFLSASGQARRYARMHLFGGCMDASVVSCNHVIKKDKAGREAYNYFDVLVEYTNPKTGHKQRNTIKSPTEYAKAQQVKVYSEKNSGTLTFIEAGNEPMFHPWVAMAGGALMIVLALFHNQGKQMMEMLCLAILLAGAGVFMLVQYLSLKKSGLQEISAEITDVYTRQLSKETKIVKGAKYTYYPVVRYELGGRETIRRCNMNTGNKGTYQIGETLKLYYDPKTGAVRESCAKAGTAVVGGLLVLVGLLALGSTVAVMLGM